MSNDASPRLHRDLPPIIAPDSPVGRLRQGSSARQWEQAVNHRFVRELFAGTVADEVMTEYLVQDYQFFDAFISMLGACVTHADRLDAKLRFAQQLGMLAADEDGYFTRSFDRLEVSDVDRTNPTLNPATADFQALMYDTVHTRSYPHLLVMLVVAECLYLNWGESDLSDPADPLYLEWIDLHRGEDFRAWCGFLVGELNRIFPTDPQEVTAVQRRWEDAVELELQFFESAYSSWSTR